MSAVKRRRTSPSGRRLAPDLVSVARDVLSSDEPADAPKAQERSLTPLDLLLVISSVSIAAVGQVLLRYGMRLARSESADGASLALAAATSPWVIGGLGVFGLSAMLWLAALSRVPLSIAYPFNAVGYVGILTASALVLRENVPMQTWIGSIIVVVGLLLVVTSTSPQG